MKTKVPRGKPTFAISSDLSLVLRCKVLNTSFLLESLMMTFFGLAFNFKRWEASIFSRSTGVSHSLKIFKTHSFNSTSWIDSWDFKALSARVLFVCPTFSLSQNKLLSEFVVDVSINSQVRFKLMKVCLQLF